MRIILSRMHADTHNHIYMFVEIKVHKYKNTSLHRSIYLCVEMGKHAKLILNRIFVYNCIYASM